MKMITYAHEGDPHGTRFRQYAKDPVPVWAVDIQPEHLEHSEEQAEKFIAFMMLQFKNDPAPQRCMGCKPAICWQDQMVAKHWLTWIAAVESNQDSGS